MANDTEGRVAVLLAGISWQDSLLQAYRNYLLFTQSIFLAVSIGLLTAQVSGHGMQTKIVFLAPNLAVGVLAIATLAILRRAIIDRAMAVDWWQRRLLRCEQASSSNRDFTTYRVRKEHGFSGPEVEARDISDDQISTLLRPEKPKARQAFGIFVPGFSVLWVVIVICLFVDVSTSLTR